MEIHSPSILEEIRSYSDNKNLSLTDKWKLHLETKRKRPLVSKKKLNTLGPYSIVYVVGVLWVVNLNEVMPFMYGDYGPWTVFAFQCLTSFLGVELLLNWICVNWVKSFYNHQYQHNASVEISMESEDRLSHGSEMSNHCRGIDANSNTSENHPKYWSWQYCKVCNHPQPPRCRHCTLCGRCVLKRDHHCFFSRNCVGHNNFRHFTMFVFWGLISSTFFLVHMLPFCYYQGIGTNFFDVFPMFGFLRWIFGYSEFRVAAIVTATWMLPVFVLFTSVLIIKNWILIILGKTSYEFDNKIKVCDTKSLQDKLRAVFGRYWILNFIVPLHAVYEPIEDVVNWPHIKY